MTVDTKIQYSRMAGRLLDHVINGTTDWAASTMEVPSTDYTDEALWQLEMDRIFKTLPILVGVSQEIPEPGDFKTLEILGIPLLITRQKDGSAKVLMNVCTHRGMTLTSQPCGNQKMFSCPYHGWTFKSDGSLRAIADAPKFGEVCEGSRDLVQFPCHEEGGLIFAVLDAQSDVNIREYLGDMMDDVAAKGMDQWTYVGNRPIYGPNWKVAYDGYLEGYHFKAAHPETIHPRTYNNVMEYDAHGPHILIGFAARTVERLGEVNREELWQHETNGFDFIRLFFPNVSIFIAPEITQIAQMIPGPGPMQNTTILHFLHPEPAANDEDMAAREEMADWLRDVVQDEDYGVGLKIQRGLETGLMKNVIFGRNERGNQYFHRWVQWYAAGDAAAPKPEL
jgi:phenylpropionate dioxygenase-like ring-hydroxylating dioxygenase large terminal subunit